MPAIQDDARAIVAHISAPHVLYGHGLWESVAAEAWIDKAEAAGHHVEATEWEPSDRDAVARVQVESRWLTITYTVEGQSAQVYAVSGAGQDAAHA